MIAGIRTDDEPLRAVVARGRTRLIAPAPRRHHDAAAALNLAAGVVKRDVPRAASHAEQLAQLVQVLDAERAVDVLAEAVVAARDLELNNLIPQRPVSARGRVERAHADGAVLARVRVDVLCMRDEPHKQLQVIAAGEQLLACLAERSVHAIPRERHVAHTLVD